MKSTSRDTILLKSREMQQYELAAADRVDVDEASYGGSSIGSKTSEDRKL